MRINNRQARLKVGWLYYAESIPYAIKSRPYGAVTDMLLNEFIRQSLQPNDSTLVNPSTSMPVLIQ